MNELERIDARFEAEKDMQDLRRAQVEADLEALLWDDLTEEALIEVWNTYCDRVNKNNRVYEMEDLNKIVRGEATDILYSCQDITLDDAYFYENGYSEYDGLYYYKSFDSWSDSPIKLSELVDYILDNYDSLDNSTIDAFLEED